MNLVLAFIWLVIGVGVLVYEAAVGPLRLRMLGSVSVGWFALVLAAYNFVRWYSIRAAEADVRTQRLIESARARQRSDKPRPDPDPTFDFTSQPKPPHDAPPSNN